MCEARVGREAWVGEGTGAGVELGSRRRLFAAPPPPARPSLGARNQPIVQAEQQAFLVLVRKTLHSLRSFFNFRNTFLKSTF